MSDLATEPNRTRTFSHVSDACRGHSLGEESRAWGGTITNAPKCTIAVRSTDSSGMDTTAATTSAVSPERSFRPASSGAASTATTTEQRTTLAGPRLLVTARAMAQAATIR